MIQPTGLAVLARLGLAGRVQREGARIDRLFGQAAGRVVLDVRYASMAAKGRFGIGIHRACLFDALHDAVSAQGVEIRTGHTVAGSKVSGAKRVLHFQDGSSSEGFDLIIDTLGTRSPLAPSRGRELTYGALWASLDWPGACTLDEHSLSQRYRRASKMVGVLPLGTGGGSNARAAFFWSLKGSELPAWQQAGLDKWKEEVFELWPECAPFLTQIQNPEQLTFARYAHRTLARPVEERLVHIGDAWHSASPQLGQGANMALLDAWALAAGLARHRTIEPALAEAIAMRLRHIRLYQWLTWLFTPVYQSDSRILPFVRDRLVGPLSKLWPATAIQAAMVSGLVGDPLRKLGLAEHRGALEPELVAV